MRMHQIWNQLLLTKVVIFKEDDIACRSFHETRPTSSSYSHARCAGIAGEATCMKVQFFAALINALAFCFCALLNFS